ncbi:MAG: hypothetical protein ACJ8KU_06515 [Chthoniobacterales bacterium]
MFSTVSVALLMAFIALKKNYAATTDFATNHADQMRIADYLALDFRRAVKIDPPVTNAQPVTNDVSVYVPSYYDSTPAHLLQEPVLDSNGVVYYGAVGSSVKIHYYLSGTVIYRQEGSDPAIVVARDVQDFTFTAQDSYTGADAGKVIATKITFRPTFRSAAGSEDVRAATAFFNTTLLRNTGNVY